MISRADRAVRARRYSRDALGEHCTLPTRAAAVTLKAPSTDRTAHQLPRKRVEKPAATIYRGRGERSASRRGGLEPTADPLAAAFRAQQRARPPSRSRQKGDTLLQQARVFRSTRFLLMPLFFIAHGLSRMLGDVWWMNVSGEFTSHRPALELLDSFPARRKPCRKCSPS